MNRNPNSMYLRAASTDGTRIPAVFPLASVAATTRPWRARTVLVVESAGLTEGRAEISGADEEDVHAIDGGDPISIGDR